MKTRIGMTALWLVAAMSLGAPGSGFAAEEPPGPPLALHTGERWFTAGAHGSMVHEFRHFWDTAVNDGLFVGQVKADSLTAKVVDRLIAYDAATGEKAWTLKHAAHPVVLNGGRRVAFLPDSGSRRANAFQSVWMRKPTGRVRGIVEFTEVRGAPGVKVFSTTGGTGVIDFAFDDRGRKMAVGIGDDYLSMQYDIWLVDVRTREARRMTLGKESRFPDLSPDGSKLAFTRENAQCTEYQHRSGDLKIVNTLGAKEGRTLLVGDCDLYYAEPQWLGNDRLVVARMTRTGPLTYDRDLVIVDADTAQVEELLDLDDIVWFKVSSRHGLITFFRDAHDWVSVHDLNTGITTEVEHANGFLGSAVAGELRWR
jgi:hypothetical protein